MKTQASTWAKKVWGDFKAFQPGQKAVTLAAIAALIVGGILFASWKASPQYAPLYSNLSSTDASAIVQQLSDQGVDYKLENGGSQILVPKDVVYATRLAMSSEGLPGNDSVGYSLLDKEGITTSDFKQQVDYQRAIQGELAKTIEALKGVDEASVHLAIPQKNVFNDGSKKTSAAVMLTVAPGATLSDSQVQSVVYLVSSSVPELKPENVTVADSSGHVLAAPGDEFGGFGRGDARATMTQQYNQRVAQSLQNMLNTALGAGHAVVTVNATLDFDKTTTTKQDYTYDEDTPPVWTEEQTENYTNGANDGGVFGTGEPDEVAGTADNSGDYEKTHKTVTNALGTVTKSIKNTPGSVQNLSVAVLLDQDAPNLDIPAIRELVTSAAGLNTARGDSLAIEAMAFDDSAEAAAEAQQAAAAEAAAAKANAEQMKQWIRQGVVAGLILIVLLVTLIASKRRKKRNAPTEPSPDDVQLMTHMPDDALLSPAPKPAAEPEPLVVGDGGAGRRALVALADEQPDDVARVLSSWLGSPSAAKEGAHR